MKPVIDPIGRKFGWQEKVQCSGFLFKPADLNRLDPLAVKLMSQILAETLADVSPVSGEIYRFHVFHQIRILSLCHPCFIVLADHSQTHLLRSRAAAFCYASPPSLLRQLKLRLVPESVLREGPLSFDNVRTRAVRPRVRK